MKKRSMIKNLLILLSTFVLLFAVSSALTVFAEDSDNLSAQTNNEPVAVTTGNSEKIYLSDIAYISENGWSYNGWSGHNIEYDQNQEGNKLSLMIDGQRTFFTKGLSVHAKGQITYDISEYSVAYPRFIAYMGVDAARGTNGNLWIKVSVSSDGENWQDLYQTEQMTGSTPAVEVDVSINGYKYLRIYTDPCGSNAADHATIAAAALVSEDFDKTAPYYSNLHSVEYYDNILSKNSVEDNYNNYYRTVLERALVNKLGYATIQDFAEFNQNGVKALDWCISKDEIIEQIIEVGEISDTDKFLNILADLYTNNEEALSSGKFIYTKMAVALSATYTTDLIHSPLRFGAFTGTYDYLERYKLMKQLFDENKFMYIENNGVTGEFVQNDWFENLHIELIRMVFCDAINPEEILWMNGYTHIVKSVSCWMVPYISPNYAQEKLYDEANRETYDAKYYLSAFNVPYGDSTQRYWMVMEAGGICWNQSRFAQSLYRMNGIPAVGAYQPKHEMYFNYAQDENGNGYWTERYGGYNTAGTTWGGGGRYRLIFNWGAKSFTDENISGSKGGTSLGYLYLAQANLNNYSAYKKSLYYNLIADSYSDNNAKVDTYFKALETNSINLDSYDYIINLYKQMSDTNDGGTITSDDWYNLALKVTESYKYYPVAMYDLLNVIRPYLEGEKKLDIDTIEKKNLTEAVTVSDETLASIGAVNAGSGVRTHAKSLLGLTQPDPISFSFDGENAGKLMKNSDYSINWAYSLDGGNTYSEWTSGDFVELTQDELNSISAEKDILVKIMGLNDYCFTIDITEGTLPSNIYANDWENRVIGASDIMEWRLQGSENWTPFKTELPDLTGDQTVEVRTGFTGTTVPSATTTYQFTSDNQPETAKYIPIEHLSIHNYSSQSIDSSRPFYAPNAIDGNMTTLWHTDFRYDVRKDSVKPFITIKLDTPRNLSALEFAQIKYKDNDPDFIQDAIIYVSVDGENWTEAGRLEGCSQENKLRRIDFDFSVYGQYVKIEMNTYNMFASLAMVNLYEDTTVKTVATFSFDGNNAGKIVLTDEYKGTAWEYSLDGGATWKEAGADEQELSSDELQAINTDNNIKIRMTAIDTESTIYIHKRQIPTMPNSLYLNDLENRLIGLTDVDSLEWKIEDGKWTSYSDEEPIVTGTRKLYVRNKAAGSLTASDALEYSFTEDNQPDTEKYIPIKHLSVYDFSSEAVRATDYGQVVNAIDGNANTKWHTDRTVTNDEKYITIKLDEPRYLSKIQYNKEPGYLYGVPKNGIIYTSMNGSDWQEVLAFENLYNPANKTELAADVNQKDIVLNESVFAQYIKIQVTTSCDYVNGNDANGVPYNYFFSSTMLNLFEDTTKAEDYTAAIGDVRYKTLQEAVNAAQTGEEVILLSDVTLDKEISVQSEITLNLNAYTLTSTDTYAVKVYEGGNLTVKGSGTVQGASGKDAAALLVMPGAKATLNETVKWNVGADANQLGNTCICSGGEVVINGGTFSTDAARNGNYMVLDIQEESNGSFVVKGGTFVNYNPADGHGTDGGSFVADGYKSENNGADIFSVQKCKLEIKGSNLIVEENIKPNIFISEEQTAAFDSVKVEFKLGETVYTGIENTDTAVAGYKAYTIKDLAAKQMADIFQATAHGIINGETVEISESVDYSIAQYVKSTLAENTDEALTVMLIDMLAYGAEAQNFYGYNTDTLATDVLTAEQVSVATMASPAAQNDLKNDTSTLTGETKIAGASLELVENANIIMYVLGDVTGLTLQVKNTTGTVVAETSDFVYDENVQAYIAVFDGVSADQMRSVYTFALTNGETVVSNTVSYSIATYCSTVTGDVSTLAAELLQFGDSASAYFA